MISGSRDAFLVDQYHPQELVKRIKTAKVDPFRTFWPFTVIQSNPSFDRSLVPSL